MFRVNSGNVMLNCQEVKFVVVRSGYKYLNKLRHPTQYLFSQKYSMCHFTHINKSITNIKNSNLTLRKVSTISTFSTSPNRNSHSLFDTVLRHNESAKLGKNAHICLKWNKLSCWMLCTTISVHAGFVMRLFRIKWMALWLDLGVGDFRQKLPNW